VENPVTFPPNLDELQMPDWEQLEPRKFQKYAPHGGFAKAAPVAQLITTRGCPYSCRYCAAYVMNGKKIRMRSGESVVEEMQYLIKDHGIREFHIEDDNFTFYKEHVVNVCSAIRKAGLKVPLGIPNGVRVDRLDDEICAEMKSAGFYFFSIGLESGSVNTLKQMKKALNLDKAKRGIELIKKYGFRVKGFFILGYPNETREGIFETIRWSKSLALDQAYYSIYIPLPGTPEFLTLEENGLLDIKTCKWEDFYTGKFADPPYIPDGMTARELKKLVSYAYASFYLRPRVLLRMAGDIASATQCKHLAKRAISLASGLLGANSHSSESHSSSRAKATT
jgi:anaerobic magnesium-protoporphyrin IX monomethyl ester cyclase